MNEAVDFEKIAVELRRAFDLSFASPPPEPSLEVEDLVAIRVAGDPYAIRLRDIAAIVAQRRIVRLRAAAPAFLGLAGNRGDIVPVFALSSLLGYAEDANSLPWIALCGAEEPVGLAFPELEGHLRLTNSALRREEGPRAARPYVNEVAIAGAQVRAVIAVPLVVAAIRDRRGPHRPGKES
jgi:purine-binding chemotaxis protein CheW